MYTKITLWYDLKDTFFCLIIMHIMINTRSCIIRSICEFKIGNELKKFTDVKDNIKRSTKSSR